MPAPIIPCSNSIAATTLKFCLFKDNVNVRLKTCSTDKLAKKLRELIEICCQNLFYI